MRIKQFILLFISILACKSALSQFTATPTPAISASTMAQLLVGKGVTISNVSIVCPNGASGSFISNATSLGIDSGVVLTTGNVLTYSSGANTNYGVNSAASFSAKTDNLTVGGDADLATSAGQQQSFLHDMCKLEFDFVPLSDTIKVQYKFASEEYPEYNCTQFNDVFGLYISGQAYTVPTNMALVPGTSIPVSVNSVNDGTTSFFGNLANCTSLGPGSPFTSLYTNNAASTNIVYDGMTNLFTARAIVTPCSTYHFKVAIADLGDGDRDSGIFLKANSFTSDAATIDSVKNASNIVSTSPYVMEGCSSATVYISRPIPKPTPLTVNIVGQGSATLASDYTMPASVVIPANATTASFTVTALNDALTEGTEVIKIYIYGSICANAPTDSVNINILEYPKYNVSNNDTICIGSSATLTATTLTNPSAITYLWNPGNNTNPTITVSPTATTTYTLSAIHPGCANRDSLVTITVAPKPTVNAGIDKTICNNSSTTLSGVVTGFSPYLATYSWSPSGALSNSTILNPTASPLITTNYTLTATTNAGCTSTDVMVLTIAAPMLLNSSISNALCNAAPSGSATITASGNVGATTYSLSPTNISNSNGIFSSLVGGTYTATVTDAATCSKTITFTIGQGPVINFNNPSFTPPNCNGQANGGLSITANGGSGSFSYSLSPGGLNSASGTFNNITGGNYTITATDGQGCTKTSTLTLSQPLPLSWASVTKTNATCNGYTNGVINCGLSGGSSPYIYTILPQNINNTTGIFSNLGNGSYTITGSDSKGCSLSTTVNITQPAGMTFGNPSIISPTCAVGNNGSFTITATGGAAPTTYAITPGAITNSTGAFVNLGIGAFVITATDANNCTKTSVVNLSYTSAPSFVTVTKVNINCFGQTNGSISASASGGTGAINYILNPGNITNTTGNYSMLASGVYTIIARDANQCTTVSTVTITTPALLNINSMSANGPLCNGTGNGNITLNMSGGTSPFTYVMTPGAISNTTGIFSNLNIGSYTITITDSKGCTRTTAVTLTQPTPIVWNGNNTLTHLNCFNQNIGTIGGTASGGTGLITYNLLPANINNTTGNFTNLAAGTFTVTARDVNNCSITKTVTLTQPTLINLTSSNIVSPSCVPNNNGSFSVTATGGSPGYTYTILNNGTTNTTGNFANLTALPYSVQVTDSKGCTRTLLVNVPSGAIPIITNVAFVNPIECGLDPTDSLQVLMQGSGSFTFTLQPSGTANTTGFFNNLSPNTYTITVLGANGCTVNTNVAINIPPPLTVTVASVTQPACANNLTGSFDINASGGALPHTFTLLNNGTSNLTGIFTNLSAGIYSIEAKDTANCRDTVTVTIAIPPPIIWSSVSIINLPCNGIASGSITPIATGGTGAITYTLNPGNISTTSSFNNILAGTYTIIARDVNNCSISSSVVLTQPPLIVINTPSITSPTCQAPTTGIINISATGGTGALNYTIGAVMNTTGNFSGLSAGTYTVIVRDANNCSKTTQVVLIIPNAPFINNVTIVKPTCPGNTNGSFTVSAAGGSAPYSYSFNGGAFSSASSYSNLAAGNYTITARDFNNCTISTLIQVLNPPQITLNSSNLTHLTCNNVPNGSIALNVSGGTGTLNYTLLPGNTTNTTGSFGALGSNSYTINIVDANNCSFTTTISISQPTPININSLIGTNANCVPNNSGSINTTASGGTGALVYTLLGVSTNSSGIFNNLFANTYTVQVRDANNCTKTSTILISTLNSPLLTVPSITAPICFGMNTGSISISSTGGTGVKNYTLNPGNVSNTTGSFTNIQSNTYTINVTDAAGCSHTTIASVSQPTQIQVNNILANGPLCFGAGNGNAIITAIGGTGALNYTLNPGNIVNTSGIFNNLLANIYTITLRDANNCTMSSTINIVAPNPVTWNNFNIVHVLCRTDSTGIISALASGGTGLITYTKLPGAQTTTLGGFSNLLAGTYTIVASDVNNCSTQSALTLTQPPTNITITNVANTIPTCIPGNDATISITASGGTGNLSYSLSNGLIGSGNTIQNVGLGTFTIVVTDANSCTKTSSIIISNPNAPSGTNTITVSPSCFGGSNGSINLSATGGTGPVTFTLKPNLISNSNGSFTGLNAQGYTITITDSIGCGNDVNITLTQPTQITFVTSSITAALCFGSTGNLSISGSGGTGSLSYNIQPLNLTNTSGIFNTIPANTYTATATDNAGCTSSTFVAITTPPALYWFATNTNTVSCNGGNNGLIAVNARGGTGTITYLVNPGNISDTIGIYNNLPAAIYTVTAFDANGCSISSTFNINQPPQLAFPTLSSTSPTCLPGNDAILTASASGGVSPYVFSINANPFTSSGTFSNLGAGVYTVSIRDANNCIYTQTILISNPSAPNITSLAINTPSCFGFTNGSITTNISGGTGNISYTLLPNNSTNSNGSFNNLNANTYTLSIQDAANCTVSSVLTITQPNPLTYNNIIGVQPLCHNGTNGILSHTTNGGSGVITTTLLPGNLITTNDSSFNLSSNTYTVNTIDAKGCTLQTIVNIANPPLLQFNNPSVTHPTCFGLANGILSYNAIGGTGALNYSLSPVNLQNGSGIFTGLSAPNNFTITVTDANNCIRTSVLNLTQPTALNLNLVSITGASCSPGADGTVSITASGGTNPLVYTATNGSTTTTAINGNYLGLSNTTYTIIVTDLQNCSTSDIVQLVAPNSPNIITINSTQASCVPNNNGSLTINANQGTPPLQYQINGGTLQSSNQFNNLIANTYTATVRDSKGCTSSTIVIINTTPGVQISSNIVSPITCFGFNNGSITLAGNTGTQPYTLSVNNTAQSGLSISNLSNSIYTCVLTDANGCTSSVINSLTQPTQLTLTQVTTIAPSCFNGSNGSISMTAVGGTGTKTFTLNPSSASNTTGIFNSLIGNTSYTMQVTDANNCTTTSVTTLSQPTPININTLNISHLNCGGLQNGIISTNASGGTGILNYLLAPSSLNNTTGLFNNLVASNYTLVVTDANNCSVTNLAAVTQPATLIINITTVTPVSCNGLSDGNIQYNITGGTGIISTTLTPAIGTSATGLFSNLNANSYTINAVDVNNCTKSILVAITEPQVLTITSITATNNTCYDGSSGSMIISTQGGNNGNIFTISPLQGNIVNNIINNLPNNQYTISVTDSKGCTSTSTAIISSPPQLILTLDSVQNLTCFSGSNGALYTSGSGGFGNYTFTLLPNNGSNQSGTFVNMQLGNYTIVLTDANGCTSALNSLIISQPTPLFIDTIFKKNVQCYSNISGQLYVQASGGGGTYTYTLLPPNISNTTGQFDSLQYGAYTLQIQDNIGCIKDTIIQIDQNAQINLSSLTIKNPTCFNSKDGSFFFSAEGGVVPLTFSVNGSPFTADTGYYGLSSGNYFVIMKDSLNCIADTIISLVQPDSLELFIDSTVDVYCYPQKTGMIFSHATGGNNIIYTYILSPVNKINTTGQFTNLGLGTYTIFVKDSLGCLSSKKVTLNESPEKMVPTIVASEINCVDTNSKGTATVTVVGGYPPYTYGWTNNPPDSTETAYNLIYGPYIVYITDSAGCTIADTVDIGASSCCEVYFPNAFTPNNDFLNDDWTPIVKGTVSDYYLQIFDRWGNRVYNSSVPNKAWDGKYKELPMDIDTYFYLIQYKCTFSNENRLQKGSFHLFR